MSLPRVHAAIAVTLIMKHKAWFLHEQHQSNFTAFVSIWTFLPFNIVSAEQPQKDDTRSSDPEQLCGHCCLFLSARAVTVGVWHNMRAANMAVQGLAPFGADIAVLVHNPALDGSSPRRPNDLTAAAALSGGTASDATGVSTELQHERPELKIFTWAREEVAADALSITGTCYACILAMHAYLLCCVYGAACRPLGPPDGPTQTSMPMYVTQLCMWQTDRPALYLIDSYPLKMRNAKAAKTLTPTTHQTTLTKLKLWNVPGFSKT